MRQTCSQEAKRMTKFLHASLNEEVVLGSEALAAAARESLGPRTPDALSLLAPTSLCRLGVSGIGNRLLLARWLLAAARRVLRGRHGAVLLAARSPAPSRL